jgi:hypothetical protein
MTHSVPGTELPPANRARIARATQALIVCAVCLVVEVGVAVRLPGAPIIVNTIISAVDVVLAWLARTVYGWLEVTPARLAMVKVVRWVPAALAVVGGAMNAALAAAGLASSLTWVMTSFLVMLVSVAAAGVAGAAR